ncbi:MAG: HNH endonuclease [Gemmatimonadaceae bacterium]|nr:HNH endonuclease [Gemmatimonadaceae bacterium]
MASDIDFGDDVESWLVNENGVLVFPGSVAGLPADEAANERRAAYAEYLKSSVWRAKREGALKNAWFRCEECGDQDAGLHVHHVSYDRVGGAELPKDLQVLCEDCHYHHHAFARAYMDYVRGRPA